VINPGHKDTRGTGHRRFHKRRRLASGSHRKTGQETYLAQVINLVRQAQASRSRTQDLANRSAALLFYVALGAGMISFVVWSILRNADFALERAVTVLVIACPHALGLAIPLVVAISTAITARNGILIRDRRAFRSRQEC